MPDKFKGCELIFPDTLIFCKGKAKLVIKCDKDWCLTSVKAAKVPLGKICTEFQNVVRERKKDLNGPFTQIYRKQLQLEAIAKLS